jgi:hypothetical protein
MAKFRKKPVVIESIQWTGDNAEEINDFMGGTLQFHPIHDCSPLIHTLEGDHLASRGDWIIRGVAGEFYPCKDHIFRETYDPVD